MQQDFLDILILSREGDLLVKDFGILRQYIRVNVLFDLVDESLVQIGGVI